jgi:uncharacterized protein YuzB (UPF0349 family)
MNIYVKSYNEHERYHVCDVVDYPVIVHENLRIDLMVNRDFPKGTTPQSLVGNIYTCERLHPYIQLAMNVNPNPIEGFPNE